MVLRRTRAQRTSTGRRDRRTERCRRAARRAGLQAGLPQAAFLFGCTLLFSFAQMPFGSMPAAPAFFAALLAFDEAAVWGMAGVVAGALAGVWRGAMMQGWQLPVCIAISLAMPVARRFVAPRRHGMVFALSALAASLPTLFVESVRFLPALRCLELAACVLILTPVFGRLLHLLTDRADARADDVLCALLFILCVLCGLCGMNAGFLARTLAAVGTACIALACGPGAGVAFGGATGLTLTLLGRTPAEGVLLLVAGLLCGVARRWGRWGVAGAMGAAALCAGATVDPSLFRPGPMASVLAAACAPALCPPAWLDRLCARVEPLLDRETAADAVRSLAFHSVRDMANGIREMTDALPAPDAPDETEAARVERRTCARAASGGSDAGTSATSGPDGACCGCFGRCRSGRTRRQSASRGRWAACSRSALRRRGANSCNRSGTSTPSMRGAWNSARRSAGNWGRFRRRYRGCRAICWTGRTPSSARRSTGRWPGLDCARGLPTPRAAADAYGR